MGGIFISYRREDTGPYAGRLRDTLSRHFGADQVFRDIDTIQPGERFPHVIEQEVSRCDALLAVIGPNWLNIGDTAGRRRLDNPNDYLRQEIAIALARPDVRVVPVLVGNASMPGAADLPRDLAALAECNAVRITDDGWEDQAARLIRALEPVVRRRTAAPLVTPHQPHPGPWGQPPGTGRPTRPTRSRSALPVGITVAVIAAVVILGVGFVAWKVISDIFQDFGPGNPTVVLSPSEGPPGTEVVVSGTGYGSDETVEILFHATEVGTTLAKPDGSFTATITIPDTPFRNQQFDINVTGKQSIRHDSAPFMVT